MERFFRYFVISIVAQVPLVALLLLWKVDGVVYFLYFVPLIIIGTVIPVGAAACSDGGYICLVSLLIVPVVMYSLFLSLILVKWKRKALEIRRP